MGFYTDPGAASSYTANQFLFAVSGWFSKKGRISELQRAEMNNYTVTCRHIQENFAVSWTLPMCFDTLALAFAVAKLTKIWRAGGQSRLVRVLIRDQVLWFLLIEAISIVNLLVAYATPGPLGSGGRGIVSSVLTTLTSISVSTESATELLYVLEGGS